MAVLRVKFDGIGRIRDGSLIQLPLCCNYSSLSDLVGGVEVLYRGVLALIYR